jgi:hypothetical protein
MKESLFSIPKSLYAVTIIGVLLPSLFLVGYSLHVPLAILLSVIGWTFSGSDPNVFDKIICLINYIQEQTQEPTATQESSAPESEARLSDPINNSIFIAASVPKTRKPLFDFSQNTAASLRSHISQYSEDGKPFMMHLVELKDRVLHENIWRKLMNHLDDELLSTLVESIEKETKEGTNALMKAELIHENGIYNRCNMLIQYKNRKSSNIPKTVLGEDYIVPHFLESFVDTFPKSQDPFIILAGEPGTGKSDVGLMNLYLSLSNA